MPSTVLTNGSLLIDESLRRAATELADETHDRIVRGLKVELEDGGELSLSPDLVDFVSKVLRGVAQGAVSVTTLPEELTTTMAADVLGISRPTLMKHIHAGEIAAHKVGTHTRLRTVDVLHARHALGNKLSVAFEALRAWDDAEAE